MRERTIMTLVVIAILAMTSATALADKPAAPARFVDGGATYFLYEGYSLVWNDGGGDEEITTRLYVAKQRPSADAHPASVVVVCIPRRNTVLSVEPYQNARMVDESKMPRMWILTLRSEGGALTTHLIDAMKPLNAIAKQDHPIYFQHPTRVIWAPVDSTR